MEQLIKILKDGVERTKDILKPPFLFTNNNECKNVWSENQDCDIKIQKVGNRITLTFPRLIATANTAAYIEFLILLPSEVRPAEDHYSSIHVTDNSVIKQGTIIVKTTGVVLIYAGLNAGVFTGSGDTGFESTSVTYVV